MDLRTALAVATLMTLLNGLFMGLTLRGLSTQLRPAATDWCLGTMLMAVGSLGQGFQEYFPPAVLLPLSNGSILFALGLYWRAARRFDGRPDTLALFVPALLASLGILWFASVTPSFTWRVVTATAAWSVCLLGAARGLWQAKFLGSEVSRKALIGIFLLVSGFMLARAVFFVWLATQPGSSNDAASLFASGSVLVVAVLPVVGTTAFLVLCSERVRKEAEHAASTDYLTGLPNRRTISREGTSRFEAALQRGTGFAVAVIDIDHFKRVNDRYGHDIGDLALQHVATLLAKNCRGQNMVGRHGGEEFVALIADADLDAVRAATQRLREAVQNAPFRWNATSEKPMQHGLTVSMGVGRQEPQDLRFEDLLRRADAALYVAKAEGRNRVAF